MKRIVLFVSMAAAVGCTGAKAADLAAAPYTKAPVAVPIDSWAGIYIGGQIGYDFTTARYDLTNAGVAEPFTPNMNSVAGGGHIGAQGQWGRWVLGVEGNFNWTDMKETDASAVTTNRLSSMAVDGLGSVVGKVGWAFDGGWMFYGKGGWAVADVKTSITAPVASVAKWQSGWTIGGGLEKQIAHNWIVGAEVDYYSFKFDRTGVAADGSAVAWSDSSLPIYSFMAHLSYLFNVGGPVVAKY